jgi:replicative DNA helicase
MSIGLQVAHEAQEAKEPVSLPHDFEFEHALLGEILYNNAAYHQVSDFLRPEHFYARQHALIYDRISSEIAAGRKVDALLLRRLISDEHLVDLGGWKYLVSMASSALPSLDVSSYGRVIYELAERRRTLSVTEHIRELAANPNTDSGEIVSEAIDLLVKGSGIPQDRLRRTSLMIGEEADTIIQRLNDVYQSGKPQNDFATTGSPALNRYLGGWRRKHFYIIGGRPSMGKTSCALSWLLHTAKAGHGVLFVSLEMGNTELTERALSELTWRADQPIEYERISKNHVDRVELERLIEARHSLGSLPVRLEEKGGLTVIQVRTMAQQFAQQLASTGKRLAVVCIDHIGLLRASDRYHGQPTAEMQETTASLKTMAKDLDIAVIGLSQLNRALENRDNKRPQLSDLRQSGSIEQDADAILFAHREAYYLERRRGSDQSEEFDRERTLEQNKGKLENNIAKNRGGPTRTIDFFTDITCSVVRDLAQGVQHGQD